MSLAGICSRSARINSVDDQVGFPYYLKEKRKDGERIVKINNSAGLKLPAQSQVRVGEQARKIMEKITRSILKFFKKVPKIMLY